MITPEPQLSLFESATDDKNLRWLEHWLRASGQWWTAAELRKVIEDRLTDRDLRSLASASEWIISGQKGYRHLEAATLEEIDHAAAWMESQAGKMARRATLWRHAAHRRIG